MTRRGHLPVRGARVLVTGATGGIGRAVAETLGAAGARSVLSSRPSESLDHLAAELGAEARPADLTQDGAVDALLGPGPGTDIDVLVAAAGVAGGRSVEDERSANIDEILDVNLRSPILLATELARRLVGEGRPGHIVLVASLGAFVASPLHRVYNASKFGLRGFGLGLRSDLANHDIGVTVLSPGYVGDAGMLARSGMLLPAYLRTRSAAEVADAVLHAIRHDPAEILVAPPELQVAARLGTAVPAVASAAQRRSGVRARATSFVAST